MADLIESAQLVRAERSELAKAVLDHELPAGEFPQRYASIVDRWLEGLFVEATGGKQKGYALVGVGGYGRGELSPGSDLDLVLVYRNHRHVEKTAQSIWYTIWDTGIKLDYSVRTRREVLEMCREDLKVVIGWLDARLIAGDASLVEPLIGEAHRSWRDQAREALPRLQDGVRQRHRSSGELAFLLEPDLKASAGGLRDAAVVRALGEALPILSSVTSDPAIRQSERLILAARVATQVQSRSATDKLALQEQDQVAAILGYSDADALMAAISQAGRTIAIASDEAWHRADFALGRRKASSSDYALDKDVVLRGGEIALSIDAVPAGDPTVLVRVALAAAQRHALIDRASLDRLEAECVAPPVPWPPALFKAFIELLGTGSALIPAVEALDQRHLFELLIPEWSAVRNKPQRNAYHRYTVDRHLLEAIATAGEHVGDVDRPDLLLLAAMFHDIGKGFPGDHSEVGKSIAATIATRMGLSEEDVAVLVRLVAFHLLLPECATRRDLDDPATVALVARLVEDRRTLTLLAALTEADGIATGTSAWGSWKAELVTSLVERVGKIIDGAPLTPAPQFQPDDEQLAMLRAGQLALRVAGKKVTVVAPDRPGLLAVVSAVLSLHGCNVRRATAVPGLSNMAIEIFDIEAAFDREINWSAVERDLALALDGNISLENRLAERDRNYARARRVAVALPASPHVVIDNEGSQQASIIEVRATDRMGLLHAITSAIAATELDVVSAIVDTLGHEVIDTFYVRDRNGDKLNGTKQEEIRAALQSIVLPAA